LRRNPHGLERHAADRTMAGAFLHDLRMHRAGVERALGQRLRLVLLGEIALRLGRELSPAPFRAEIKSVAFMLCARAARADVDLHPAHGIGRHLGVAFGHLGSVVAHRRWALPRRELDSVMDLAAVAPLINWMNSP